MILSWKNRWSKGYQSVLELFQQKIPNFELISITVKIFCLNFCLLVIQESAKPVCCSGEYSIRIFEHAFSLFFDCFNVGEKCMLAKNMNVGEKV